MYQAARYLSAPSTATTHDEAPSSHRRPTMVPPSAPTAVQNDAGALLGMFGSTEAEVESWMDFG